jgi:hypothetical protein
MLSSLPAGAPVIAWLVSAPLPEISASATTPPPFSVTEPDAPNVAREPTVALPRTEMVP